MGENAAGLPVLRSRRYRVVGHPCGKIGNTDWTVEETSVLDRDHLSRLGQFDVVYSWGVLHHTGAMLQALENVAPLVAGGCSSRSITIRGG